MKRFGFYFVTLFLLFSVELLTAKEYPLQFSQISTENGLSQNTVRAIIEDQKGFIWAGTLDGLNRYDGYRIVVFKPELGNTNSLSDHRIKNVYQDQRGYLWIKTYSNEFSCYNPATNAFINYRTTTDSEKNAAYQNYYESPNGDIWLWGNGCLRIKKQGDAFHTFSFSTEEKDGNKGVCKFLFEDSQSAVWIGGNSGLLRITGEQTDTFYTRQYSCEKALELGNRLYIATLGSTILEYDMKRKSFREIQLPHPKDAVLNAIKLTNDELLLVTRLSGPTVFNVNSRLFERPLWANDPQLTGDIDFIADENGGVWIYNHSGIVWYHNPVTTTIRKMELIPADVARIIDLERYNVLIDSHNLIWITTYGNGLFVYDPETDSLSNYRYKANMNSPASDYLLDITEDTYGNIWVGSEYAGIIKVVKSAYDINYIRPEKETSIGKNNNVRTVYDDDFNRIWVGTKNGSLYLYNSNLTEGKMIFKDINPYVLTEDTQNRLWIGTKGKGLYVVDKNTLKETHHFTHDPLSNHTLSYNTLFSILRDTKNRIWIGTFGGGINLVEETPAGISFRHFFPNEGNRSYIRCLFQDSNGFIWAGTSDGIIRFHPDELLKNPKAYTSFRMDLQKTNGLNCNDIKTIFEDNEKAIWIGTAGGGLNNYVPASPTKEAHFVAYTTKDGMTGDFISGILEDRQNNLWISTESGITKFDRKNHSFIVYKFSEKTYGNCFNENASLYCNNGNMLWGSLDGVLVFNPDLFVPDNHTLPVTFTNFSIYNQEVRAGDKDSPLKQSISYTDKIKLNYKQNTFTIEFASLGLKDPMKNKYMYTLKNYDKQWSAVGHQNSATYKNLPPGKYLFKVKGTNSDGIWNQEVSQLEIEITPPFWKAWYAYIVYGVLILFILFITVKLIYKFNALNNNIKVEKELTNYKLRFFTNISHEFRTPLTLIRGAVESLNMETDVSEHLKKQIKVLRRNSLILNRLIEQLLEFRKIQNNVLTLDLEETDIIGFSNEIYQSFQEIADQKNITYRFSGNVSEYKLYIDRRKLDKILYNLISNAFKFTPKDGKIEMEIQVDPQQQTCLIRVKDTGIGIPKEKQHLLFSRFMQINFSSNGTGVGLSLVKEFVDVHKGKIWYEDNQEQGSVFNVELSTNKETYQGANFIASADPDMPGSKNKDITEPSEPVENIPLPDIDDATLSNYKMLIIDDNDDIRSFLTEEFSTYFMVDNAEDGKKGLEKAEKNNPDLIICDVMMPEMDGFEVTRRLKENFETCHIPMILLTAHSSAEHQLEGVQSGADAYITKPFSLKYLVTKVFKLIEQREQLKKRFSNEYVLDGNLITTTDKDKEFYDLITKILEEHVTDSQFSISKFSELTRLNRTLFYKKVKGITGISPNELIKINRLKKAAKLLLEGDLTVSEISYKVGFEDPFYFSKCFKAHFNCSPSKYSQPRFTEKEKKEE